MHNTFQAILCQLQFSYTSHMHADTDLILNMCVATGQQEEDNYLHHFCHSAQTPQGLPPTTSQQQTDIPQPSPQADTYSKQSTGLLWELQKGQKQSQLFAVDCRIIQIICKTILQDSKLQSKLQTKNEPIIQRYQINCKSQPSLFNTLNTLPLKGKGNLIM